MGLIWFAAAALWGMAEATLFFIAPDVLLTLAVTRFGFRPALRLAVTAAASAALVGIGMWWWGAHDPASARAAVLAVPAIGPDLLARAHRELASDWAIHLFTGSVTGVAYKLYAVEAGARGIPLLPFVLASIGARLGRFLLTMGLTAFACVILEKANRPQWSTALVGAGWIAFYAVYFTLRAVG